MWQDQCSPSIMFRIVFWAEAIYTACHTSNRLYYHRVQDKTPYELLVRRKPNISYFWVFGCKCYILKKGTRLSKFQSKCDEGFLLGYSSCSKAYRVYNKTHDIVKEVYDVEFDETQGSHEEKNLDDCWYFVTSRIKSASARIPL